MVLNCNGHTKTLHCGHQIVQLILILNKMIRDIGEQWFCFYILISKEDDKMNEDPLIGKSYKRCCLPCMSNGCNYVNITI